MSESGPCMHYKLQIFSARKVMPHSCVLKSIFLVIRGGREKRGAHILPLASLPSVPPSLLLTGAILDLPL